MWLFNQKKIVWLISKKWLASREWAWVSSLTSRDFENFSEHWARFHWSILFSRFYEISHFVENRILRKFACEKSHFAKIRMRKIAFRKNSHFAKIRMRKFAFRKKSHAKIRILRKIALCENSQNFASLRKNILIFFAFASHRKMILKNFRIRIASHFYFQCEGTSLPVLFAQDRHHSIFHFSLILLLLLGHVILVVVTQHKKLLAIRMWRFFLSKQFISSIKFDLLGI